MTDSLDETNETWGRRLFEPEPLKPTTVLVLILGLTVALGFLVLWAAEVLR